ncbi:hypothetical protein C8R46DRAFT_935491 [Mycena filopes]|nr:hypothetical protein C8R46DRAFT_935491 [Mycena filopes]
MEGNQTEAQPGLLPAKARAQEMTSIDEAVAWHYAEISRLKAKRNAMAPISALPNELMTRILTIYAVESDISSLKWVKVMDVCRHWYELARAEHSLWGFINLLGRRNPSDRLFTQLEWSGIAPLTIKVAVYSDMPDYTYWILTHCERIFDLEAEGESQRVYELIAKLPECNLPMLHSLSLDPSFKRDELPDGFIETIPDALFDGRLPKLRELVLKSVAFPWGSLSGLISLCLTRCHDSTTLADSPAGSFRSLLGMLASCPELRILKLESIIPLPIPEQHDPVVELPALTWLRLLDDITACTALLTHLRIPASATVHLLPYGIFNGADVRDILVPIRKHTRGLGAQAISLLQIDCYRTGVNSPYCTLAMFADTQPHDFLEYTQEHCAFSLNCHPSTGSALRQILTKVLNAVPAHLITHLDARNLSYPGEASWKVLIQLLPALDTVYLRVNSSTVHCVHALTQLETFDPQSRRSPLVQRLHVFIVSQPEPGDDTLADLLTALEEYFVVHNEKLNPFGALEFDDSRHVLGRAELQLQLERLFPLMGNRILWNDQVYDPVKRKEKMAKMREEWTLMAEKYGLGTVE